MRTAPSGTRIDTHSAAVEHAVAGHMTESAGERGEEGRLAAHATLVPTR